MEQQAVFHDIAGLMAMITRAGRESPTYQRIALYIEKNYLQIIFLTANELAVKMGVSQGSVSRFFMTLGYKGYNGFLRNLQEVVSQSLTGPQRLQLNNNAAVNPQHRRGILTQELRNMESLSEIAQGEAYEKMVAAIISSLPLYLVSARLSATLLPHLGYELNKMRANVHTVTPESPRWETLEVGRTDDCNVIVVSFPRYANSLIHFCQRMHRRHFPFLAVTDSRLSPIVPPAASTVLTPITTSSLFDVYSTPLMFFNILMQDAAKRMPDLQQRMAEIEAVEIENNVYFSR